MAKQLDGKSLDYTSLHFVRIEDLWVQEDHVKVEIITKIFSDGSPKAQAVTEVIWTKPTIGNPNEHWHIAINATKLECCTFHVVPLAEAVQKTLQLLSDDIYWTLEQFNFINPLNYVLVAYDLEQNSYTAGKCSWTYDELLDVLA